MAVYFGRQCYMITNFGKTYSYEKINEDTQLDGIIEPLLEAAPITKSSKKMINTTVTTSFI